MHGRHARILGQIFGIRPDGQGGPGNTVLEIYWDGEMQFYSTFFYPNTSENYRKERKPVYYKSNITKNPIY